MLFTRCILNIKKQIKSHRIEKICTMQTVNHIHTHQDNVSLLFLVKVDFKARIIVSDKKCFILTKWSLYQEGYQFQCINSKFEASN